MSTITKYRFLTAEPGSTWDEPIIQGTGVRASTLAFAVRNDGRTPCQVAADFDVPLDAVLEAIDYVDSHSPELDQHRQQEFDELVRLGHMNPDGTWKPISTTTPTTTG
jgi:uncharacterized protein (DUF433 family)